MKSFDTFIQEVTAKFAVVNDKGDTLSLHMTSKEAEAAIKRHERSLKLSDLKVVPLLKSCGKDMHEGNEDYIVQINQRSREFNKYMRHFEYEDLEEFADAHMAEFVRGNKVYFGDEDTAQDFIDVLKDNRIPHSYMVK